MKLEVLTKKLKLAGLSCDDYQIITITLAESQEIPIQIAIATQTSPYTNLNPIFATNTTSQPNYSAIASNPIYKVVSSSTGTYLPSYNFEINTNLKTEIILTLAPNTEPAVKITCYQNNSTKDNMEYHTWQELANLIKQFTNEILQLRIGKVFTIADLLD